MKKTIKPLIMMLIFIMSLIPSMAVHDDLAQEDTSIEEPDCSNAKLDIMEVKNQDGYIKVKYAINPYSTDNIEYTLTSVSGADMIVQCTPKGGGVCSANSVDDYSTCEQTLSCKYPTDGEQHVLSMREETCSMEDSFAFEASDDDNLEDIWVTLNEKFKLHESQTAIVRGEPLSLKYDSMMEACPQCECPEPQAGQPVCACMVTCTKSIVFIIDPMMDCEDLDDNTLIHRECGALGRITINEFSKERYGDYTIHLKDIDDATGVALIYITKDQKPKPVEGVDISIEPETQTMKYGESVTYKVTVTDKHTPVDCAEPMTSTTGAIHAVDCTEDNTVGCTDESNIVSVCSTRAHAYRIHVNGLPLYKEYPKTVYLAAGQSETFRLKIAPYQRGVDTEDYETPEMGVVDPNLGNAHDPGVTILEGKPGVAQGYPVTKVSKSMETVTGNPVASGGTGTVESDESYIGKPVEEMPDKEEYIYPDVTRKYRFTVKAVSTENSNVYDTAKAILIIKPHYIKPKPVPPPFPGTEKISIKLYDGWNLVSLPGKLVKFDKESVVSHGKLKGFVWLKDEQRYVTMNEAEEILGDRLRQYLAENSFWVYTRSPMTLNIWVTQAVSYNDLELAEGWNLMPITSDMVGGYLEDILGDCELSRLHLWDARNQAWEKISLTYEFSDNQVGYGFLARSEDSCNLEGPEIFPPDMPEE